MSIHMHANIIQQKHSTARWAISTRTKDKTLSVFQDSDSLCLLNTHLCARQEVLTLSESIPSKQAWLLPGRQQPGFSLAHQTSDHCVKARKQRKVSLVHVHHTQIFQTIFIQFPPEIVVQMPCNALELFGTSLGDAHEQWWKPVV